MEYDNKIISKVLHGAVVNADNTLLARFIKDKISQYVEPQREGTSKGNPIGPSREKYFASLLMMTNRKIKDIASSMGISFGTLRNWNTQDSFKELIENHCKEFTVILVKHIEDLYSKYIKNDSYAPSVFRKIDISVYGETVMMNIYKIIEKLSDEFEKTKEIDETKGFVYAGLTHIVWFSKGTPVALKKISKGNVSKSLIKDISRESIHNAIFHIKNMIWKKNLNRVDRISMAETLIFIEENIKKL